MSPAAPHVTLQEIAAAKEYPGGFTVLRPHTEGYAMNFYKSRSELARQWSERSRQEILGYWPQFAFGNTVADRNSVARADLSGLRRHTLPSRHPRLSLADVQLAQYWCRWCR